MWWEMNNPETPHDSPEDWVAQEGLFEGDPPQPVDFMTGYRGANVYCIVVPPTGEDGRDEVLRFDSKDERDLALANMVGRQTVAETPA
jgi:hypothetical protein